MFQTSKEYMAVLIAQGAAESGGGGVRNLGDSWEILLVAGSAIGVLVWAVWRFFALSIAAVRSNLTGKSEAVELIVLAFALLALAITVVWAAWGLSLFG